MRQSLPRGLPFPKRAPTLGRETTMEQLQLFVIEPGPAVPIDLEENPRSELITLMADAMTAVYRAGIEVRNESVVEPEDSP
jgi:hypothetical protein